MPNLVMCKELKGYKVFNFTTLVNIGRDEKNDIILNDPNDDAISRYHAYIERIDDKYILYDRSTNGTMVNNEIIKEFTLTHGITFQVIDYTFTFIDDSKTENIQSEHEYLPDEFEEEFDETATIVLRKPVVMDASERKLALRARLEKEGIIIESQKMIELYQDIQEIARINVPVLILGEPGTGKEKVASTIHDFSNTRGNFVPLNCSSIPEGIFESELFGSVKGAFHQAVDKPGKLELAHNGTIFLDEIGDMHTVIQPKLLRFLEDKQVTRLGDTKAKTIDLRVVSATNQDLSAMMLERTFREDLYQRIACIKLKIPPLRERVEDIIPLSEFFLKKFSKEHNLKVPRISERAKKMLMDYHWPGNIRELANLLLSVSIRNQGRTINPDTLSAASEDIKMKPARTTGAFPSMEDMEKQHVKDALQRTGWHKVDAAKILGISRDTLYKKMKKYKITEPKK